MLLILIHLYTKKIDIFIVFKKLCVIWLLSFEIRILELSDRVRSTKRHFRRGDSLLLPYLKPTPSEEPVPLIRPETAHA